VTGETAEGFSRNTNIFEAAFNPIKFIIDGAKNTRATIRERWGREIEEEIKETGERIKRQMDKATAGEDTKFDLAGSGGSTEATDKTTDAISRQLQSLADLTTTYGWARDEVELYKLAQAGATEEQLAYARSIMGLRAELEAGAKAEKDLAAARDEGAQSISDLNKQLLEKQKSEREKELQAELEGLEKIKAKREEIAAKTVDGFIEEQRAAKDAEKQKEADAKKADRLRKAEARGTRLSKSNREFLDAFTAIEEAGAGLAEDDPVMKQLDVAKDNLEQLKNDGKTLADILAELETANAEQKKINQDLTTLLRQA
jgi:hypothetical protein